MTKKTQEKKTFWTFLMEIMVPAAIFVFFLAPNFMGEIWDNVKSDNSTPGYVILAMHVLSILICVCWIEFYNCIWRGIFGKR